MSITTNSLARSDVPESLAKACERALQLLPSASGNVTFVGI